MLGMQATVTTLAFVFEIESHLVQLASRIEPRMALNLSSCFYLLSTTVPCLLGARE